MFRPVTGTCGHCPTDVTYPISRFTDASSAEWYHDGVHWAFEAGVIKGMGDGTLVPQSNATRAKVATMLQRFSEVLEQ